MDIKAMSVNTVNAAGYAPPSARDVKKLTHEITEEDLANRYKFTGEGIYLSELAARGVKNPKPPKISQQSLRKVEFDIQLMQAMKTQRIAGQSTNDNVKDLTAAYDTVRKGINKNSENSNKHVQFLDDAFSDIAKLFFTEKTWRYNLGIFDSKNKERFVAEWKKSEGLEDIKEYSERNADLFTETFLKNYKQYGVSAYDIAMSAISGR
ncbi:MAG: hypothetical protein LBR83_04675 [Clostridiales bacterium]|jgi:hypothetical protein|nr:hypothetical protein [Clostridiales bacterium]